MKDLIKVFIISNFELIEEQKNLEEALVKLNCIPINTPTKEQSFESTKVLINSSDLIILLISNKINKYIEKEYSYSKAQNKNIIIINKEDSNQSYKVINSFLSSIKNKNEIVLSWRTNDDVYELLKNYIKNINYFELVKKKFKIDKLKIIYCIIAIILLCISLYCYFIGLLKGSITFLALLGYFSTFIIMLYSRKEKKKEESDYNKYLKSRLNDLAYSDSTNYHESLITEEKEKDIIALMLKNSIESTEYFAISKKQAKSSYIFSIVTCSIGIVILIGSVLMAFLTQRIEPAIIAVVSGAITELIAGTVLWVHKKSALQLNHYYDALHENEKFLSAINLADRISNERRDDVYFEIVKKQISIE